MELIAQQVDPEKKLLLPLLPGTEQRPSDHEHSSMIRITIIIIIIIIIIKSNINDHNVLANWFFNTFGVPAARVDVLFNAR